MPSGNRRVSELFLAASELDTPESQAEFLQQACAGEPELRAHVESLLAINRRAAALRNDSPAPVDDTTPQTPASESAGTMIGPYKLLEAIGEGGMGAVWIAEQTRPMRRKVAIKLVKPGMDSRQVLSRFEAERQALALMDHPNIAKVYDGGMTEQGRPYFVMEYVKGIPLNKYCDDARLPLKERLRLFVSVCQAVQHAHQKGIIHRDLKPSNILVCLYDGQPVPKVIDFGLAKAMHQPLTEHTLHTAHGFMVGTPLYMSPEQAEFNNLDVDTRTDIYSLGVILYELLTGSTPLEQQQFKQAAFDEMLRLIKEVEPPKPSTRLSGSASLPSIAAQRGLEPAQLSKQLRGDLDWIVMKTLEKERSRRYETANGLARDIERFLHDEPVEACPPSTSYRLQKLLRKHRRTAIAAAAVMAALVLGIAGTSYGLYRARLAVAQAEKSEAAARMAAESEEKQRKIAETSAEAARKLAISEGEAKKRAEQGQVELQAVLDFVTERIFAAARPTGVGGGLGRSVTLREAIDSALPFVESSFGEQPQIESRLRGTVALSYLYLEDYATASAQFNAAYRAIENRPGTEREQAFLLINLANCRSSEGKHDEAIQLRERGMALVEQTFGATHRSTLNLRVLSVGAYVKANRLEEAESIVQESVRLLEETLGPDHPDTNQAKEKLADIYFAQNQVDDALDLYQRIIDSNRKTLGVAHPATCEATWTWANAVLNAHLGGRPFRAKTSPEQALASLEASVEYLRVAWGDRSFFVIDKLSNLAYWYGQFSRYDDAVRLMEELVAVSEEWTGPDAESTLDYKTRLASAYLDAARPNDGLILLESILPRLIAKHGADITRTQYARELRVGALRELGETERANEASRDLLALLLDAKKDAVDVASLRQRGHLLARASKWKDAIGSLEKVIAMAQDDESSRYYVAYLYAMTGDREGYRKHCKAMLARHGATQNPTLAERVSKPCMLMPDAGLDLAPIVELAQVSVGGTEQHPYYRYFLSTRALAHFRCREYQQAYDVAQASISGDGQEHMNPTTGWFLSSMALAKLGRREEAVVAQRNATEALAKLKWPAWNSGDLGDNRWHDVVFIHVLQTECDALLQAENADTPQPSGD